jgi:Competence protein J (ComJ)
MTTKIALSPRLYFSYSQFMVYDGSVQLPGCEWTEEHTAQGFARRESVVNFNTLLEFGDADVAVKREAYQPQQEYHRVIVVPFRVTSGKVVVEGPEETTVERSVSLPSGQYRLVAAQYITGEEEEVIDLYFEPLAKALERSTILLADQALNPPTPLIETAKVAGET